MHPVIQPSLQHSQLDDTHFTYEEAEAESS